MAFYTPLGGRQRGRDNMRIGEHMEFGGIFISSLCAVNRLGPRTNTAFFPLENVTASLSALLHSRSVFSNFNTSPTRPHVSQANAIATLTGKLDSALTARLFCPTNSTSRYCTSCRGIVVRVTRCSGSVGAGLYTIDHGPAARPRQPEPRQGIVADAAKDAYLGMS